MASSLVWQKVLGVPVENYFFDEGSWGNDGISFSLIQTSNGDDYVKPAALTTMTTTRLLAGRPYVSMPSTGIPHAFQADFGPTSGGATDAGRRVDRRPAGHRHGHPDLARRVDRPRHGHLRVRRRHHGPGHLGHPLQPAAVQPDRLPHLPGRGHPHASGPPRPTAPTWPRPPAAPRPPPRAAPPSAAINGNPVGYGNGWESASGDTTPSLTDTFATTTTIDRIVVDTQSVGSTASSVRNYTLSADVSGTWTTVATETGQYRNHILQFAFAPVAASAIRITVSEVNFGGYYGGGIPPWWPATQIAPAFLHTFEAYAGTGGSGVVGGSSLPALLGGSSGGGTGGGTTTTTAVDDRRRRPPPPCRPTTTTTVPPTTTTRPATTTTTTTTVADRPRRPPTTDHDHRAADDRRPRRPTPPTTTTTTVPPTSGPGSVNHARTSS